MEKHLSFCFKTENIICFVFLYDLKVVNLGVILIA